jgi:hypothetical protein
MIFLFILIGYAALMTAFGAVVARQAAARRDRGVAQPLAAYSHFGLTIFHRLLAVSLSAQKISLHQR